MGYPHITLEELKNLLEAMPRKEIEETLPKLKHDPRKGVQSLIKSWEAKLDRRERKINHWKHLCQRENSLQEKGYQYVAGIDESGRGPLAGPVVAAAVILDGSTPLWDLDDSKKLTPRQRKRLYGEITSSAVSWAVSYNGPEYIDSVNILQATKMAMVKALNKLTVSPDYLLLDAIHLSDIETPQEGIVGGDGKCACIAAASVLAKVTRDNWMQKWDQEYPGYGFAQHKGYPTPEHLQALLRLGPSPIHRLSFQPLADLFPTIANSKW